jgi:ribulose-5-phosphate 4-epimerase/fuculose-1-phosphate aldolase
MKAAFSLSTSNISKFITMAPSAITETASTAPTVTPKQMIKESENSKPKTALELISQGQSLPGIPTFPSYAEHRQWMLSKMALAFRVFARKGYTEGMSGHISVRDPENPHTFWTNPLSKHFGLLKASDMILVDYDGKAIGGNMNLPANAAGFLIHSAVHKARPDVTAACHTHSPYGKAWSSFAKPLEMLNQDVTYFYGDAQAVYEVKFDALRIMFPPKANENAGLQRCCLLRRRGRETS